LKKKKALYQLIGNFFLWTCVCAVFFVVKTSSEGMSFSVKSMQEFLKFADPKQLGYLFSGAAIFFGVLKFIEHKTNGIEEKKNANYFADIALDELASGIYTFGSIILVGAVLGENWLIGLIGIVCYVVGYWLKPSDNP
jgi:hypothetical protein